MIGYNRLWSRMVATPPQQELLTYPCAPLHRVYGINHVKISLRLSPFVFFLFCYGHSIFARIYLFFNNNRFNIYPCRRFWSKFTTQRVCTVFTWSRKVFFCAKVELHIVRDTSGFDSCKNNKCLLLLKKLPLENFVQLFNGGFLLNKIFSVCLSNCISIFLISLFLTFYFVWRIFKRPKNLKFYSCLIVKNFFLIYVGWKGVNVKNLNNIF